MLTFERSRGSAASPLTFEHFQDFVYYAYTFYVSTWLLAISRHQDFTYYAYILALSQVDNEELWGGYHFVKRFDFPRGLFTILLTD
jgi:hypothetical protein